MKELVVPVTNVRTNQTMEFVYPFTVSDFKKVGVKGSWEVCLYCPHIGEELYCADEIVVHFAELVDYYKPCWLERQQLGKLNELGHLYVREGCKYNRYLTRGTPESHIAEMKRLWEKISEYYENYHVTWEDILNLERKLLAER